MRTASVHNGDVKTFANPTEYSFTLMKMHDTMTGCDTLQVHSYSYV